MKLNVLFYAVFALLLVFIVILQFNVMDLEGKNNDLNNEVIALQNRVSQVESERNTLIAENEMIETQKESAEKKNVELGEQLSETKEEVNQIISEIDVYKEDIQESISKFKNNANLAFSEEFQERWNNPYRYFQPKAILKAVDLEPNSCNIRLYSIYGLMELWKFEYLEDTDTEASEDHLQDLDSFIRNEGGDCEDYSLFFKASYNYLVEYCEDNGIKGEDITLQSFEPGTGTLELYPDSAWEFVDVVANSVSGHYMYIICGSFSHLSTAHCLVALSDYQIKTGDDVYRALRNTDIVEPQQGRLLGKLEERTKIPNGEEPKHPYIWVVITDDDLYLYSNNEWISYKGFDEKLDENREKLEKFK